MSMMIDKVTGKQKKAIDTAVKSARPNGNGKNPQTAQQTITFQQMYRDGICTADQYEMYQILQSTRGNRPDLF